MAFKKPPEPPKTFPLWQSTFSDLMNLLLCFFVLLFSMSTLTQSKIESVAQSVNQAFSILPSGGSNLSDGILISNGMTQLPEIANYFGKALTKAANETGNQSGNSKNNGQSGKTTATGDATGGTSKSEQNKKNSEEEAKKTVEEQSLKESEKMSQNIEKQLKSNGIQDNVEIDFNGQYVRLTLNGAFLFDSGKAELKADARPIVQKISQILNNYKDSLIEVEGHTDNVPIHSAKYEDNNVLSAYRALNVANDIRQYSSVKASHIYSSGRGEYDPVASNKTPEGRARNRRVEIKIYNSYYSKR
ncbi:MAG: chemotaxis protein [Lachnospiraceae bacterium]|uniref:OmpA family protein n=1 Tax=Candidatus Weimeria bifida TaxID=2599074 RepID=A0A6N7IYJ2_9FIRM|nr:OmpA family protein [Candidatus Weimeria bifida]RRF96329.1 MAG: chemotaxis protein [Lachnospiraceae bacterium]